MAVYALVFTETGQWVGGAVHPARLHEGGQARGAFDNEPLIFHYARLSYDMNGKNGTLQADEVCYAAKNLFASPIQMVVVFGVWREVHTWNQALASVENI